ncbi:MULTISPECIES: hypothetical protein [unclassified Crossiella]|uniref:hypothetical protein n=1 Tax=unclassified Crossiella TaxID=2620835 RepID=UPI001FFE8D66|nr:MULTISPECIES: hypothetical protein [unclassified Crossiella]MCK2238627.1 hypothetical protein [Crossiella sp. S99.2]MCK2251803.1 hypothetical protein [Crossiella sp. S99.1]
MGRSRSAAIRLVRELMSRPEQHDRPTSRGYPVLVVAGSRGSGKTTLLTDLARRLDQHVPYARLDLEAGKHASIPQLLSALASQLNRWCRGYGHLRFPRLAAATVVMALDLPEDRPAARRQVLAVLQQRRRLDTLAQILETAAGEALGTVELPPGVPPGPLGRLAGSLVGWASGWRWTRVVLGRFLGWFKHQDRDLDEDALEVLVDINEWARDPDHEQGQYLLEQLLCRAFLADLRAGFGTRRAAEWSLNCVALLDNADTPVGRRFLLRLTDTRKQTAPDPLTLVVTSRGPLLDRIDPADVATLTPRDRTYAELQRRVDPQHPRWLHLRLPDLTEDEVRELLATLGARVGDDRRIAHTVHRFTGGHPAAARLLVDALRAHAEARPEIAELLTKREPHGLEQDTPLCVADRLLHRLLQDYPVELDFPDLTVLTDLVTCAAARTEDDGLWLAGQAELRARDRTSLPEIEATHLWSGSGNLLRRLLLHRLARRAPTDPAPWSRVFDTLRRHSLEGSVAARYYALAAEDLAGVAAAETQRLKHLDTTTWLAELHQVTAAPNRLPHRLPAVDEVATLLHNLGPAGDTQHTVAGLIAALWLDTDPLHRDTRGRLHQEIATHFTTLATYSGASPTVLLDESRRYQRLAEQS